MQALRQSRHNPGKRGPTVVTKRYRAIGAADYDVCVAGGTLGVFLALALQVHIIHASYPFCYGVHSGEQVKQ